MYECLNKVGICFKEFIIKLGYRYFLNVLSFLILFVKFGKYRWVMEIFSKWDNRRIEFYLKGINKNINLFLL